jgi:thiol-disulfide isomerase/thioredoxin
MWRRLTCLISAAVLCLAAGQSVAGGSAGAEKPAALTLRDMQGAKAKLGDLRGKIVVLNFWATWCGPCNVEMPMLVKAANSYAGKQVIFVGASVDSAETQGKVAGFVQKLQIGYPIWVGGTDVDMKRLQLGNAVPGTAFLDADGIVRARILGQMRPGEIEERVDWLLRGQEGNAPAALVTHLDERE